MLTRSKSNKMNETCAICCELLDSQQPIKTVHKDPHDKWNHRFHEKCIDKWYVTCIADKKNACCPLCPGLKIPKECVPLSHYREIVMKYCNSIKEHYNYRSLPYFGFIICIEGECVMKLTNLDFEIDNVPIHYNSTLRDIKQQISQMGCNVYYNLGGILSSSNFQFNRTLKNWKNWKYPSLQTIHTCYTIPPRRIAFGDLEMTIDDDKTLAEMYVEYHTHLAKMKNNETFPEVLQQIRDITSVKNLRWHQGFSVDDTFNGNDIELDGYFDRAFMNPENPFVQKKYCDYRYNCRATRYPLAWMAIHVQYDE